MSSKTVDENYKRLRAELDRKLSEDKRLGSIADKIAKGTADFTDTAKYTQIVSKHMSDVIKHNIGDLKQPMAKEMVCKELMRDHYDLINGVFGDVQISVDEKMGIHIKPVKPAYPTERVDTWAHSLEDPTVEQSVIERRAASGSENIGNSMHDNCIEENAKWRDKAGLDTYLVRDAGGGCCPWCQALEGRYEYASAPDDIFRRHDNCTCTVTYECGKMRQDVWSKRTWQADPKDVEARIAASEAAKPTVKTPAEAQALNEQSKPVVHTPAEAKELEQKVLAENPITKNTPEQAAELEKQMLENKSNVNNLSLEKQGESDIMPVGHKLAMAENGDVLKYDVEVDPKSVEEFKSYVENNLGIKYIQGIDKLQNGSSAQEIVSVINELSSRFDAKYTQIEIYDGGDSREIAESILTKLRLNSQYMNRPTALQALLDEWENDNFIPKGCNSTEYVGKHEYFHMLFNQDIDNPKSKINTLLTRYAKDGGTGVSTNGDKSRHEFVSDLMCYNGKEKKANRLKEAILALKEKREVEE